MRSFLGPAALAAGALLSAGCASAPVERRYEGLLPYVPIAAEEYAAFLTARYLSLTGDVAAAPEHYLRAARLDPDSSYLLERGVTGALVGLQADIAAQLANEAPVRALDAAPFARIVRIVDALAAERPAEARAMLDRAPLGPMHVGLERTLRLWARHADLPSVHARSEGMRLAWALASASQALPETSAGHAGAAHLDDLPADSADGLEQAVAAQLLATAGQSDGAVRMLERHQRVYGDSREGHVLAQALRTGEWAPPTPAEAAALSVLLSPDAGLLRATPELAVIHAELALRFDPACEPALFQLAGSLAALGRNAEAAAQLRRIPEASPRQPDAKVQIAAQEAASGKSDAAISALMQAEALGMRRGAMLQAGDLYRQLGRHDDALRLLTDVIEGDVAAAEPDWRPRFIRADVLRTMGRWPEAEADLIAAMEQAPDQPDILNYLGFGWVDRGERVEQGLRLIEQAAAARPRSGPFRDSLGWAHYRLGDFETAVEQLEEAAELDPANPVISDHLGDAYWRLGRRTEARIEWARALVFNPDPALAEALRLKLASQDGTSESGADVRADAGMAGNETR